MLVKQQIKETYNSYLQKTNFNFERLKKLFSYVLTETNNSRIRVGIKYNNQDFKSPLEIVNAFAHFFESLLRSSDPGIIESVPQINTNTVSICEIEEKDVILTAKKN